MKVISKLADVDFQCGLIERKENQLLIHSHPSQAMKTEVYVSPRDIMTFLASFFKSPSAILFIVGFPYFWWKARSEPEKASSTGNSPSDPW